MDRFNSLGAMQVLFYELVNMNENSKQLNGIARGLYHYLIESDKVPFETGTEFSRFVKLYFDVCLYPHKEATARAKPNKPTMEDYISVMRSAPKFSDQLLQIFVEPPEPPPIVVLPRVVPQKQGQVPVRQPFGSPIRVAIQPTQVRLPPRRGPAPVAPVAPVATRKTTPKYLTRAAVAANPALVSQIVNTTTTTTTTAATATLPVKTGPTRHLVKKTRKHRR